METLALIILIVTALVGFIAIFFTTFGTLIITVGSLIFAMMTGFQILTIKVVIILLTLYFIGEVFEYFFIILGAKKLGASNAAVAGALIGGVLGAVLGVGFLGVGLILGTFFGIFLGAFFVELLIHKDIAKAAKAGAGGVLGRVGSVAAKIIIAVIMFVIIAIRVIGS